MGRFGPLISRVFSTPLAGVITPGANWSGRKCCSRSTGARGKSIGKWMVGFDGSKSMQMAPFCTQAFDLGSWNYYPCGDLEFWVGQPRKCTSQQGRAHDSCSANCSYSSWEVLSVNPIKCIGFSRWPDLSFFLLNVPTKKTKAFMDVLEGTFQKKRGLVDPFFDVSWWESERNKVYWFLQVFLWFVPMHLLVIN